jgi:hypothetical protein
MWLARRPIVLGLANSRRTYVFGEVRVATLALLTFTVLSGRRSSGVVITKFSGHAVTLPKFTNGVCRYSEISVCLNSHLIWQTTKSDLERGSAFGLISHKGLP